jgi:hypothetical protein
MAYSLASVDFGDYGVIPGRIEGGNISVRGAFDMPSRIGDTVHEWGDDHGLEIYTEADDLFYGGRDITFDGFIPGTRSENYDDLKTLLTAVKAATGLQPFATPYGTFSVYAKSAEPSYLPGVAKLRMEFREPVVTLTGGTLPATGVSAYTVDNRPFTSFGLYASAYKGLLALPEMQEQQFTKIEAEGYSISKRRSGKFDFSGFVMASGYAAFLANIKNLYALFTASGERTFVLNNQLTVTGALLDGFRVDNVRVGTTTIANIKFAITPTSIT